MKIFNKQLSNKMWLVPLFLATLLFLINSTSAILCDTNYLGFNYNQSEITTKTIHCSNQLNQTVSLTKIGDYFTMSSNSFSPNESKDLILTFDSNAPIALHQGQITFSDSSDLIQIFFYVQEKPQQMQTGCSIDIFPLSLSGVKIQSGDKKVRTIQLSVPSCYNTSVNVKSLSLQTDEKPLQLSEVSLGILQPGGSLLIPIEIDAESGVVSNGQYSDILSFLLYDSNGNKINVPTVSLNVLVTTGINPISNLSLSMLPSCSLDAIVISSNNTHKLTCTITNPNIKVVPEIDTKFLHGVNVISTSSQYIYEFKGIQTGITTFIAKFKYMDAQIGSDFAQEIKITPSGASVGSGITLKPEFYQNGVKKEINNLKSGEVIILTIDNSSGNIVHPSNIFVNGITSNNTINLEYGKMYEIRIEASGYMNMILSNLSISEFPLDFSIFPVKDIYETTDTLTFNCSVENVTYLVNDARVNNPYTIYQNGNLTIKVIKEGYISANRTINVVQSTQLGSCTPIIQEWKKGINVQCSLTKNIDWEVYNNGTRINSGSTSQVNFKIEKSGTLEIKANGKSIYSGNIDGSGFGEFFGKYWYYFIGGILLFGIGIFILSRRNKSGYSDSNVGKYEFSP